MGASDFSPPRLPTFTVIPCKWGVQSAEQRKYLVNRYTVPGPLFILPLGHAPSPLVLSSHSELLLYCNIDSPMVGFTTMNDQTVHGSVCMIL